jgi:acyl-ACP thioesterase
MIDFNNHVHNTDYLDFVDIGLPKDINGQMMNNVEIMYKKQIVLDDKVNIHYTKQNDEYIITVKSEDDSNLHSIIKLY